MMNSGVCPFGYGAQPATVAAPKLNALAASDEEASAEKIEARAKVTPDSIVAVETTSAGGDTYYSDYLQVDKLLSCQQMRSRQIGKPAHDEMLFIVVHQVYELWFKQILHELDHAIALFAQNPVPEKDIAQIYHTLARIVSIEKLLVEQIEIIETLSPLDFLDFRDLLYPASGFQSWQFRLIENKLGMMSDKRVRFMHKAYHTQLSDEHATVVQEAEAQDSLFAAVERWLERIPFLEDLEAGFSFWDEYKKSAGAIYDEEKQKIISNSEPGEMRDVQLQEWASGKKSFFALLDESAHEDMRVKGQRRLSFKATQAALLITLYRDEPVLSLPWNCLNALIDIDNGMQHWRHRHSMMAHRMIGTKVGTGGSSGYYYLRATLQRGRIFDDISNLSTYLLPKRALPSLPPVIRAKMNFVFAVGHSPCPNPSQHSSNSGSAQGSTGQ
eukprot:TRINITY_DN13971_c0_g1_i1.p1 TRINITY_DN13971_c0_g1~~TRINITY_DN13971_c0_g1_i1.p1  ORF type:complete len:442 (+),score=73.28 TRINITY_DN13971_c0_g1_i1:3-1328(+)